MRSHCSVSDRYAAHGPCLRIRRGMQAIRATPCRNLRDEGGVTAVPTGQCFLLSQPGASIALSATFQINLMKREQPAASPQRVCNDMQGIHHSAV